MKPEKPKRVDVLVHSCIQCPHRLWSDEESDYLICDVTDKHNPTPEKIPKWCPLPDDGETEETRDTLFHLVVPGRKFWVAGAPFIKVEELTSHASQSAHLLNCVDADGRLRFFAEDTVVQVPRSELQKEGK